VGGLSRCRRRCAAHPLSPLVGSPVHPRPWRSGLPHCLPNSTWITPSSSCTLCDDSKRVIPIPTPPRVLAGVPKYSSYRGRNRAEQSASLERTETGSTSTVIADFELGSGRMGKMHGKNSAFLPRKLPAFYRHAICTRSRRGGGRVSQPEEETNRTPNKFRCVCH
jgi:hypothetical protein